MAIVSAQTLLYTSESFLSEQDATATAALEEMDGPEFEVDPVLFNRIQYKNNMQ